MASSVLPCLCSTPAKGARVRDSGPQFNANAQLPERLRIVQVANLAVR